MGYLKIDGNLLKTADKKAIIALCPFNAIEREGEGLAINAACKMCKLCVKHSGGVIKYVEEEKTFDKSRWKGIAVFGEFLGGELHPVTHELIGKAKELAEKTNQRVTAVVIGHCLDKAARELSSSGADKIYLYDDAHYANFLIEPYKNAFAHFIQRAKPSCVLFPSTNLGRTLAPPLAAMFNTGLTADCTQLEIKENTDLMQIRPAFGGNIMAQIVTPAARPQFCTVRYKVFSRAEGEYKKAEIIKADTSSLDKSSLIKCLGFQKTEAVKSLAEAEIVVACGRGVSKKEFPLVQKLAEALRAQIGCSRPLVESGLFDARCQIGLSGRTIKPKLIITLGVSGSVQFRAGMLGSDFIVAVNTDANAPIFDIAHLCVVAPWQQAAQHIIEKQSRMACN